MVGVSVLAAWFVGCAGEDVPLVEDDLRDDLDRLYGDGAGGQLGNAGAGGNPSSGGGAAGAGGDPSSGGGAAGAAGAGGGEPVGGGGGDVCEAYESIIVPRCGNAGCHNDNSSQGSFAIDGDEAAILEFVDRPSTVASCDGLFIDTANIEDSLLLTKLETPVPTGCGNLAMPLTGDPLTPEEVDCLTDWLTQFE